MNKQPATYTFGWSDSTGALNSSDESFIEKANKAEVRVRSASLGLLCVTPFCSKDIPLLKKRVEWFNHIEFSCDRDILLVADADVDPADLKKIVAEHRKFFRQVFNRQIKDYSPQTWPQNVNHVFRTIVNIFQGYYGEKFSWDPYTAWFYFEPDVTLLKPDAIERIEDLYKKGGRPFMGFINTTTTNSGPLRHMNGAGIYPSRAYIIQGEGERAARALYTEEMILSESTPWDVAGMNEKTATFASIRPLFPAQYLHAFGTTKYKRVSDRILSATQTLNDGSSSEKEYELEDQIIHHGCKDGSLIDLLISK